jgi:hypothetical protein
MVKVLTEIVAGVPLGIICGYGDRGPLHLTCKSTCFEFR